MDNHQDCDLQDWNDIKIARRWVKQVQQAVNSAKVAPEVAHARKFAEADTPIKTKKLSRESRQEIANARVEQKWSQQDLNLICHFPDNTIREIEAGRLVPNIQQLNTLNDILKVSLKLV